MRLEASVRPKLAYRAQDDSASTSLAPTHAGRKERGPAQCAPDLAAIAKRIYGLRRRRDAVLGDDLFGEPAWDLVLDLYTAEQEDRQICISSACLATAVPTTTALRWIRALELRGMVIRTDDPRDARRSYLKLSPAAKAKLEQLLGTLCRG